MTETYKLIAEQSYDTIPREIGLQLEMNPQLMELKFVKVQGCKLMYDTYAASTSPIHPLREGSRLVAIGRTGELADLLQREVSSPECLPREVRVLRPEQGCRQWAVFVQR